jgi:hypothetical protein
MTEEVMDQNTIWILTIVAGIILIFIAIYFLGKRIIAQKKIKTGKNGEKVVKKALEKIIEPL